MTNTIGRYELRSEIGRGGMAAVYRAYDAMLNREVALKVMAGHLGSDPSFQRRFEREAQVIATLEHPNIVPVYDYGITAAEQPYLVMRLLRGGTLQDRLAQGGLTRQKLWAVLSQVASALDYAHDRDIIHRDIKPVNVLFDEKGNAYVSDFGIAKVRDATTNLTGNAILGTPAYMSPEQFLGAPLDGRSDQYSLAVLAFQALSGRVPFTADTLQSLMFQHVSAPPPEVHTLDPSLSPATSAVLRRALAKEPAQRYDSATEFIEALQASAQPGAAAAQRREIDGYYETGRQAFQRQDWPTAVDFLGRVIAVDRGYRDASQLHQTANYRLQERRGGVAATQQVSGAATQVVPPAPATRVAPEAGRPVAAPRPARRWPLLLGLLALLIIGGAAAFYFLRPDAGPEPTPTAVAVVAPTTAATATSEATATPPPPEPTPVAGAALVVEVGSASVASDGGRAAPLQSGAELPLRAGAPVSLAVDEGRTQLVLPSGARVYLDAGAEADLTAEADGTPLITVKRGRLATWSHADPVTVLSAFDGRAVLLGPGLMGVNLNPGAVSFAVACLEGSCDVSGANDAQALRLRNGQASTVGVDGFADRPAAADRAPFEALLEGLEEDTAAIAAISPTAPPTEPPTAEPTAAPTEQPTAAPTTGPTTTPTRAGGSATSGTGSNTTTLGPGASLDFENFGTWTRGDQENGTFASSTAQAHGGARSAELAYNFATADNDFVVFFQEHAIDGQPNLLRLWVYGDGSGHYLNAWIEDAAGQTWQAPFGRVTHQGWQQMEARIETGQAWPWTHISGPQNDTIEYPIRFRGFVLDDRPDDYTGQGRIYLDDLTVATGAAGQAPAPTAATGAATAAPGEATPTATPSASGVAAGAILFSAGDSLLAVDPGGQPRILGPADSDTCSASAVSGGVTYRLVVPGPGCAAVGDGQALCTSPDGQYDVLMGRPEGGTRNVSLRSAANPDGAFIFNQAVTPSEGILWSPGSRSFLIVIGSDVYQVFTDLSYRVVVSGVPGLRCPRWFAGP